MWLSEALSTWWTFRLYIHAPSAVWPQGPGAAAAAAEYVQMKQPWHWVELPYYRSISPLQWPAIQIIGQQRTEAERQRRGSLGGNECGKQDFRQKKRRGEGGAERGRQKWDRKGSKRVIFDFLVKLCSRANTLRHLLVSWGNVFVTLRHLSENIYWSYSITAWKW